MSAVDDARELGRAAYRRGEHPFAIQCRQLRPALDAIPPGLGSNDAGNALLRAWGEGWSAAKNAGEPRTDPPLPAPTPTLTITYSAAEGVLLGGTSKGDGAWEAIKVAQDRYRIRGWRYFPSLSTFGVTKSRDRAPDLSLINRTAEVLREAGFVVDVQVDAAPRPMAEAEADRADLLDARADRLSERAARHSAASDARTAAEDAIYDAIPFGQPILVGHHSERRHRRDLDRAERHRVAAVEHGRQANHAAQGAASAAAHMQHRESPQVVANRIGRLEADRRKLQRELDGHERRSLDGKGQVLYHDKFPPATGEYRERLLVRAAHLDEQLTHWRAMHAEHQAAGRINTVDWSTVRPGDAVRLSRTGDWRRVVKVNKVTVSVETGYSWADKVEKHKVMEHRAASTEPVRDLDAAEVATSR